MILVISNWRKKFVYLIFAAVLVALLAFVLTSLKEDAVTTPPVNEQPTTKSDLDGGVEKVEKEIETPEEGKTPQNNGEKREGKPEEGKDEGWLKSLIKKFKAEE